MDEGPLLTLDEVLQAASTSNLDIRAAHGQVRGAVGSRNAVIAMTLPETRLSLSAADVLTPIAVTFPKGAFGTYPFVGPIPDANTTVADRPGMTTTIDATLTQPVTHLYRLGLNRKIREADIVIAREGVRSQKQAVRDRVNEAYFGAVQVQVALQASEKALAHAVESERLFGHYARVGNVLPSYHLEARARRIKQEHDILVLRDALAGCKEQLNVLMGRSPRVPFRVVNPMTEPPPQVEDMAAFEERAVQQRPEVRQAAQRVKQAELACRAKRAEYPPDVGVQVRYQRPYGADNLLPREIFTASAVVTWSPVDWGLKRGELGRLEAQLDEARAAQRSAELQVRLDVRQQYRKLMEATHMILVTEAARQTAEENLRVATERFRLKDLLLTEFLAAEAQMADARRQEIQAALSWAVVRSALSRSSGEE